MIDGKCKGSLRTTAVEFQGRLKGDAFPGGGGLGVGLLGSIEGVDVSLMMLPVMEFHDLLGDVRLETFVWVLQIGESVLSGRHGLEKVCGCVYVCVGRKRKAFVAFERGVLFIASDCIDDASYGHVTRTCSTHSRIVQSTYTLL
jgi:hypothetical protein